ncbi:MAG: CPBP family intramembrane metalloprotease [Anaerolineaceae bacterium]|nr:CPBP family intramembrane metalloprotease [Anaerolineaceae bacterium]
MDSRALILTLSEILGVAAILMLAGLSPRLNIPSVGFKYPRREGLAALSLFILILVLKSLLALGTAGAAAAADLRSGALEMRLIVAGVGLGVIILALLLRRQPPRSTGWYGKALGGTLRVGFSLVILTIILRGKALLLLNGITPEEARGLVYWLGICLAEETIFRGYIQLRLSWWWGNRWGLVATAFLFLLWEWPLLLTAQTGLLLNLAMSILRVLLLGWIAQKSKHILAPALYRAISQWLYLVQ